MIANVATSQNLKGGGTVARVSSQPGCTPWENIKVNIFPTWLVKLQDSSVLLTISGWDIVEVYLIPEGG